MSRILVLDDDKDWLLYIRKVLEREQFEVLALLRPHKVLETIRDNAPDLLITDILMPGLTGANVYAMVRQEIGPNLPVLVVSSTKMRIRGDDPLLAHTPKLTPIETLVESVRSLLATAAQITKHSVGEVESAELEIDV